MVPAAAAELIVSHDVWVVQTQSQACLLPAVLGKHTANRQQLHCHTVTSILPCTPARKEGEQYYYVIPIQREQPVLVKDALTKLARVDTTRLSLHTQPQRSSLTDKTCPMQTASISFSPMHTALLHAPHKPCLPTLLHHGKAAPTPSLCCLPTEPCTTTLPLWEGFLQSKSPPLPTSCTTAGCPPTNACLSQYMVAA